MSHTSDSKMVTICQLVSKRVKVVLKKNVIARHTDSKQKVTLNDSTCS